MAKHRGSTGDEQQDMERRADLIESSLSQVFEEYDGAIDDGIVDPVVLLLDCEDEIGRSFAVRLAGEEAVDEAVAAQQAEMPAVDITTTLAYAFPLAESKDELAAAFPYLSGSFAQPPPENGFLAIVVSSGGAASFTVPLHARPDG